MVALPSDHAFKLDANPFVQAHTPTPVGASHGRIAFLNAQIGAKDTIYVMNDDGSQRRKLADRTLFEGDPRISWSPDGKQIGFSTYYTIDGAFSGYKICIVDVESTNQRCLPNSQANEFGPEWLPDGHHLAFLSEVVLGGERKLYFMDDQGIERHEIGSFYVMPQFSPDGTQMVFESRDEEGVDAIYTEHMDGSNKRRLTHSPFYYDYQDPSWSPDGRQITFVADEAEDREVYVMNADGSNLRRLSRDSTFTFAPQWSPDGRQIAFVSDQSGNQELYVVNADGSGQHRLTYIPSIWVLSFQWSPDSTRIVFVSEQAGGRIIYIITVGNHRVRQLTDSDAYNYGAVWSP